MTRDEARKSVVDYWLEKADESMAAAGSEIGAGRAQFAMNRAYYACFYAVSAVLLYDGRTFKRHAGVRTAFHTFLVNTGRLTARHGELYDQLFQERHRLDYMEFASIHPQRAREMIAQAGQLVGELSRMVRSRS